MFIPGGDYIIFFFYFSQTPEDQQSSPVVSPPVASSDSGSLSQVRRSSQVSYLVEGFLSYLMPQNIELTSCQFNLLFS